jgi:hypothetical protein
MSDAPNITTPPSAQVLPFPKKRAGKSFYELYPMPFFDVSTRNSWAVQDCEYSKDLDTGKDYATQFLLSNDGTAGWSTLLGGIVRDMVLSGDTSGLVIGFMRVISAASAHNLVVM